MRILLAAAAFVLFIAPFGAARADEGMWTFDNFPSQKVADAYGFKPDQAWLDKVRLSSVRLAFGCSGSFISPNGLVMTNHHCAQDCITALSTSTKDYNKDGFYAATAADEKKCPAVEINQLVSISDVTERINAAQHGLSDADANAARKAEISKITKECDPALRCDVVTLYSGGQYKLYTYKPYRDLRLVFAPEFDIAFFGGDPDNFTYPRYDLDITILRAYDNGKPVQTPNYFGWNPSGPKDGQLVFVSGNPGSTQRLQTVAQFEHDRDVVHPLTLRLLSDFDGYVTRYAQESPEHAHQALDDIFGIENYLKLLVGQQDALLNPAFMAAKRKSEADFRAAVAADPAKQAKYGAAWDNIAAAEQTAARTGVNDQFISTGLTNFSVIMGYARTLVRAGDERLKPNEKRLPEYADARLKTTELRVLSPEPVYPEYERAKLTWSLTKLRQYLTADNAFVRQVLGKQSPEELAAALSGSKLVDPAYRKSLWDGGKAAVDASTDPAIVLTRKIDPASLAARKRLEDTIEAPITANSQLIGQAQFAVYGTSTYPDATFTARLSYGSVKGYEQNGAAVAPFTYFSGLYDRATGRDPFALPPSWTAAKGALNPATPMNFVSTNDIIGGNSGSPVIDKDARIVGLIFDGNIQSLGGSYAYDGTANRAVSVDSAALTAAFRTVYHADRLLKELGL